MAKVSSLKIFALILLGLAIYWGVLRIWGLLRDQAEPVSDLTYQQIEEQISRGSSLTEAQLSNAMQELQGKKVRWTGTVEDVDASNIVYIDMDRFLYDVRFPLPSSQALRLSKGNRVTFTGVIERVERYWLSIRVELRSVEIDSITE